MGSKIDDIRTHTHSLYLINTTSQCVIGGGCLKRVLGNNPKSLKGRRPLAALQTVFCIFVDVSVASLVFPLLSSLVSSPSSVVFISRGKAVQSAGNNPRIQGYTRDWCRALSSCPLALLSLRAVGPRGVKATRSPPSLASGSMNGERRGSKLATFYLKHTLLGRVCGAQDIRDVVFKMFIKTYSTYYNRLNDSSLVI